MSTDDAAYEAGLLRKRERIGQRRFLVIRFVIERTEHASRSRIDRFDAYETMEEAKQYVVGALHSWEEEQDPDWTFERGDIAVLRRPDVPGVVRLFSGGVVLRNPSPSESESVACYVEGCEVTVDPIVGEALFQHLAAERELREHLASCR